MVTQSGAALIDVNSTMYGPTSRLYRDCSQCTVLAKERRSMALHATTSRNFCLLRRRTFKSSLAFNTNVKHFESFYNICVG